MSILWEAHLTETLRALNRTCGTGKKVDYSWMDVPDPELPPVLYSANFSQYAYTHPTGLRSAIRVARVAVEMYRQDHQVTAQHVDCGVLVFVALKVHVFKGSPLHLHVGLTCDEFCVVGLVLSVQMQVDAFMFGVSGYTPSISSFI